MGAVACCFMVRLFQSHVSGILYITGSADFHDLCSLHRGVNLRHGNKLEIRKKPPELSLCIAKVHIVLEAVTPANVKHWMTWVELPRVEVNNAWEAGTVC
jgi:hypothetical protein